MTVLRAMCSACGVARELGEGRALRPHRSPLGGMCLGSGERIAPGAVIHPCGRCAMLPVQPGASGEAITLPEALDVVQRRREFRPAAPRPIAGRAGNPVQHLCATHLAQVRREQKAARRAAARERSRGIAETDRDQLWIHQGHRCAICRIRLRTERKAPSLDHDHIRAVDHDHPVDKACKECARGLLCDTCNRIIIGRYSDAALLRAIDYRAHPPAAQLGWRSGSPPHSTPADRPTTTGA